MDKIPSSEITDKKIYVNRREFMRAAGLGALATAGGVLAIEAPLGAQQPAPHGRKLTTVKSPLSTTETPNTWEHVTTYNNFYEFDSGAGGGPARLAGNFKTEPWTVSVEGECARPGKMNLEDVLKGETLEDRIYRHRCVEAWSMVIPWVGFPLANFVKRCQPTAKAKFVEFTTLLDPRQFPGQRTSVLDWPYVEGLRMDEALHPLAILGVGLYGEVLPAPTRRRTASTPTSIPPSIIRIGARRPSVVCRRCSSRRRRCCSTVMAIRSRACMPGWTCGKIFEIRNLKFEISNFRQSRRDNTQCGMMPARPSR
jgi:DMSO/TMAO reductase YedYZ molybdopterin-dependent catalytic subunit